MRLVLRTRHTGWPKNDFGTLLERVVPNTSANSISLCNIKWRHLANKHHSNTCQIKEFKKSDKEITEAKNEKN